MFGRLFLKKKILIYGLGLSGNSCLQFLRKKNNVKDGDIPFWKTPMIFYPQSLFLYDSGGYLLKENIYRFENLSPLERKISKLIGRNIKFPMLNMNGNSGYYESYTSENIEIVKDLFSIDFDNFKYSTNFEESNE